MQAGRLLGYTCAWFPIGRPGDRGANLAQTTMGNGPECAVMRSGRFARDISDPAQSPTWTYASATATIGLPRVQQW